MAELVKEKLNIHGYSDACQSASGHSALGL